jgi:SAM-dependent methyltransferase
LEIYENESFFFDKSVYDRWSRESWQASGDRSWIVSNLKVRLVKRFVCEGARILDVGCGTGEFCLAAAQGGLKCEGIDVSRMLTDIARDVLKVTVHQVAVEDFHPGHKFEGMLIWDVLEHLHDPVRVLKACAGLMEDGGYLFAQVPNSSGISNSIKSSANRLHLRRANYRHFGFPYHVYFFNKPSLTRLMRAAGLDVVHFESWSHLHKDGKSGLVSDLVISVTKKYCLSDYIVAVARKP